MKVWTYYYARLKDLPEEILPVSIAGWAPKGWIGEEYKKVAPKKDWFFKYKETGDQEFYKKMYEETVLSQITVREIFEDLQEILSKHPGKTDIALVCYEKPEDFCHRHLLASHLSCHGWGVVEEWNPKTWELIQYVRKIKSYEKPIFEFRNEWEKFTGQGQTKPQENGIYLTLRCGYSGIYSSVNQWANGHWDIQISDGSDVIAFKKTRLRELENEKR